MRYGSAAAETIEDRGVYWARARRRGCRVLYAVDRRGDEVKRLVLKPETRAEDAIAWLWNYLDHVDPGLRLMKELPPRPPFVPPTFDPYDDRAYCRQLARRGARRMQFFRD